MGSISYFEDVSKQKWTLVCNIKSLLYWFWKPVYIYFYIYITYFTKQLLYAIYTALETDKLVLTKCAKAKTNLRSEKSVQLIFYLTDFLPVSGSR